MKKVVTGNELKEKMIYAVNMLCDTVKTTLGPSGNNIIIDHSTFSPFITNDGVTIAQNIESEDEVINTILELSKESSIKTNETVGDGTTTTLVFLQSIFNDGINYIEKGINPIRLKNDLDESLKKYIEKIKEYSFKPTNNDLINIAKISSNDEEIGSVVGSVYNKIKTKEAIKVIESDKNYIEYLDGYIFESTPVSNLFFNDNKEINYTNSKVMIIKKLLEDINEIGDILNTIKDSLLIIGEFSEYFINQILSYNMETHSKICLVNISEYGNKLISILKDISAITNAQIIDKYITKDMLGFAKNIIITKEKVTISFIRNDKITSRINDIKDNEEIIDYEFVNKRISMLKSGLANIYITAPTITERREKHMRYDDAVCAVDSAYSGVIIGSGVTLLKVKENITDESISDKIISNALEKPFNQIMINSGINSNEKFNEIKSSNYSKVYNVKTNTYDKDNIVIDSTNVVINALTNAISIAGMLLTTTSIVINEYKNDMCKINDYTEL